jgi:hypothetical protein
MPEPKQIKSTSSSHCIWVSPPFGQGDTKSTVLKKGIPCFDGLSMNGNLLTNSKQTPFALSLVEG